MRQLLYTSNTNRDVPDAELMEILAASRRNNSAADITGILLYIDGGFLQVLEGPDANVEETFNRIKKDNRHWNTVVLFDRDAGRAFADWSMGFERPIADGPTAGIFRASAEAIAGKLNQDSAIELAVMLRTFYRVQSGTR